MKRMNLVITALVVLVAGALAVAAGHVFERPNRSNPHVTREVDGDEAELREAGREGGDGEEAGERGPELMREFYRRLYGGDPEAVGGDRMLAMAAEVEAMPQESELGVAAVNAWQCLGPFGLRSTTAFYSSGRILDIEPRVGGLRVAAASGGLWEYRIVGLFPVGFPLTEKLNTQVVSSFATHPSNRNHIVIGTGEPTITGGSGFWYTKDGGTTWLPSVMAVGPVPSSVFRVRFAPDGNTVHATTWEGYYRSTDGGVTWRQIFAGRTGDLALVPGFPTIVYMTVWGTGLYRSFDAGQHWAQVLAAGLPTVNVGRGAIAIGKTDANRIYVAFALNTSQFLLGVYRSTNGGSSWANVSPPSDYLGGQGGYGNTITVSPGDHRLVMVGGVNGFRSTNSCSTWVAMTDVDLHADYHAFEWLNNNEVYVASDGGWCYSSGSGAAWASTTNFLPIQQFYHCDVGANNPNVMLGATQDNGIQVTTDGGTSWWYREGGDGGGACIDPNNAAEMFCTEGYHFPPDPYAFYRRRSTDTGLTWSVINTGVPPTAQWSMSMRNDRTAPIYLYTNVNNFVYFSTNHGASWSPLNPTAFPAVVDEVTVSPYVDTYTTVYACLNSGTTGERLRVRDNGLWAERSAGLPTGQQVKKVATVPTARDRAYAIMEGYGTLGASIYRTTNDGRSWGNITGNLPNIPFTDVFEHPTTMSTLYAGSVMGCFRTTDSGLHWQRWNNGMPQACQITEFAAQDLRASGGGYFLVAGTYGRAMWKRDISGDDPVTGVGDRPPSAELALAQNSPNPFSNRTTIHFSLARAQRARLSIYDVTGRRVVALLDEFLTAGPHSLVFDGSQLSAGTYFCRLEGAGATRSRRLTLTR